MQEINLSFTPIKELFYSQDSNFGVYACETENNNRVELNSYGNFVINGVMPKLNLNIKYDAKLKQVNHKKYGNSYELMTINQKTPTTIEEQKIYLQSILTKSQYEKITKAYPNHDIVKLMKDDQLNYKKIKGIGEKKYNKIRKKIMDNIEIQNALVELSHYGVTYNMIVKLIEHYNHPSILIQKVKENPYILTEVNGLGFIKVDEYALKYGIDPHSEFRIHSCLVYILQQNEQIGHSWANIDKAVNTVEEILNIEKEYITSYLAAIDNNKDLYKEGNRLALTPTHHYEKSINYKVNDMINAKNKFKVKDIENGIKKIEEEQGFEFTPEQKQAIIMAVNHNVLIINGKAGTGKSTVLKGIINILNNYTYETCALSGKASQRIVESTGLTSKTIHRLLRYDPHNGYTYNQSNPLTVDIVVLDEASMVNNYIFYKLITAIQNGHKFIVLGDTEQLPPIGAGNIFKDLVESNQVPKIEFTQVHRQAKKSGILTTANSIRDGVQITNKEEINNNFILGELKDLHVHLLDSSEMIYNSILHVSKKYYGNIMDYQVIVPMKKRGILSTTYLNKELQNIFNPDDKPTLKRGQVNFKEGDKVIKNGNDYDNGVFNGTLGKIKYIDKYNRELEVEFIGHTELVTYSQDQLAQIDLAYALTIHRTQGSQFKNICIGFDYSSYKMLSRQLVYTGLTRASDLCILFTQNDALRHSIRNNDSGKRNTFLYDFLVNNE